MENTGIVFLVPLLGFSLGGLPTLSAPFVVPNNVQITAKKGADESILKFAYAIEQAI